MAGLEHADSKSAARSTASSRRRGMLALGAFLLVYASWQAFRWISADQALIGDLAFIPVNGAGIYTAWRASQRCRGVPRLRQAWLLVAVAVSSYLAGDLVQLLYELGLSQKPYPSVADGLYLSFYPILLVGLLRFPAARKIGQRVGELMLDIAIVGIGGSAVVVYVVLGPTAVASSSDALQTVFSIAYPVGDVIVLVGLASVLLRGGLAASQRALWLLAGGLVVFVSADLVYGYIVLHGSYTGGDTVDVLWMAALALFAVAPTLQARVQVESPGEAAPASAQAAEAPQPRGRLSWLPYGATAIGFGMFAVAERNEAVFPQKTLAIVAIVLAALVAIRQLLAQRRVLAVQAQLREARDELSALATTDALTALPNHRSIVDVIDVELVRARRQNRPFAVLFLDVDHFKALNDSHGHLAGDNALRVLGELMRGCLREIDAVGRWGGEEFVAVLSESDTPDAIATAERIRVAIAEHGFEPGSHKLTCSIGVASYPEDATERSQLVELADTAMYAAKRRGRNCTVWASDPNASQSIDEAPTGVATATASTAGLLVEAENRAQHLADHDILTGLYNRGRLTEELDRQLRYAARYARPGAALLVDIDNFKLVNDSYGQAEGDRLLKLAAELIGSRLGSTDVAGRLGGDEFVVILAETGESEAVLAADQIRGLLHDRHNGPSVQSSVGICMFGPGDELTPDDVMIGADIALYEAKEHGGDRTEVYRGQAGASLTWVDRIWTALGEGRFVLYGQPIIDLRTNELVRQELLIRMISEDGDVIPPDAFLPAAERFGLVTAIDRWVTDQALAMAAGGEPVSFNLSGNSMGDPQILTSVRKAIADGLDPESVVFEVTETAAMTNLDGARRFAATLAGLGCNLALDDFGTGFGSFTYLKHLPARYLKIDMEFVRDLVNNKTDQQVVQAICAIAHSLGKQTIAEGVETAQSLRALLSYGVDFAQGYYIGRPKRISPPTDLERKLRAVSLRRLGRHVGAGVPAGASAGAAGHAHGHENGAPSRRPEIAAS
jgi:diguanylate cyclase (GGDEF)-like protein